MVPALLMSLALIGCGDKDDTGSVSNSGGSGGGVGPGGGGPGGGSPGGGGGGETLDISVISPVDGASITEGDAVTFEVERVGVGALDGATWSVLQNPWSTDGNPVTVSDLPLGDLVIEVEAWSGTSTGTTQIALSVIERVPVDYRGFMDAQAELDSPSYSDDGPCDGAVAFTRNTDNSLTGTGSCTAEFIVDYPVEFQLTGQVDGDQVTGMLTADLGEEGTPFAGTVAPDGSITCDFDQSWSEGSGSLRIWGSFTGSPL